MRKYRVVIMIMVFMLILCFTVSCFQIRTISEGDPPQDTKSSMGTTLPPPTSTDVSLPPVLVTAPSHCSVPPVTTTDGESVTTTPETTSEETTTDTAPTTTPTSPKSTSTRTSVKNSSKTTTKSSSKATTTKPTTKATTTKTTPTTTKKTTTTTAGYVSNYEEQVLTLVNAEREKEGKAPLAMDAKLREAAKVRAEEISREGHFSHERPDKSFFFSIYDEFNISYAFQGENIAMGYGTPAAVMEGWMKSEGHRENILKDEYSAIGIGCYKKEGNIYWVQLFGGNY